MKQDFQLFEQRKKDHVDLALDPKNQADASTGFDQIGLIHDSLPSINLKEISIQTQGTFLPQTTPFFVSGMTAGHEQAESINSVLALLASERGWIFGVGSQRRDLVNLLSQTMAPDPSIATLAMRFPKLKIISNIGIAQVCEAFRTNNLSAINKIAENIGASAIAIHLNPLQEAIQPEGTTDFSDSLAALQALIAASTLPVIIKETGSGMSTATIKKLASLGGPPLAAVDVSGLGGTHWGRIEGKRAETTSVSSQLGETFKNWGISTVESVLNAKNILNLRQTELWASGGVRTGLDAAKLIAFGANRVGFAMPALKAALQGEGALDLWMDKIESELKVAMFCTNSKNLSELNTTKVSSA